MTHCFDFLDNDVSNNLAEMIEIYREKYKWERFSDKFIKCCYTNYFIGSCILSNRFTDSMVKPYLKDFDMYAHYLYATSWVLEGAFSHKYWNNYNIDTNEFKNGYTDCMIPYYNEFKEIAGCYNITWMFDMRRKNIKIKEHFEYLYNPEFHDDYLLKICEQEKYIRRAKIVKREGIDYKFDCKNDGCPCSQNTYTCYEKSLLYDFMYCENNKFADFNIDDKKKTKLLIKEYKNHIKYHANKKNFTSKKITIKDKKYLTDILDEYEYVMKTIKDIIGPYPTGAMETDFTTQYSKMLRSINKNRKKINNLEMF